MRSNGRTSTRFWRWRRSPLRRRSDVVEAWIVLGVWVLAVVGGAAVTLAAGLAVVHTQERHRAERYAVQAVLTEAVPAAMPAADGMKSRVLAPVRWRDRYGVVRTATVSIEASGPAGMKIVFWTDRWGTPTTPPVVGAEVAAQAVAAGALALGAWGGLVVAVGCAARGRLDRIRMDQWAQEWDEVGPAWRRRTT
ncbi:Rv1733c family protein [Streptomyces lunaelactis]|uniref:Rv1733c family protein n=1 Tax=Streptomyces lunaelactis TaxID=1535768 RepID=UPI0014733A1F|nr:hypothetical protein [Streptomyces lunaelactis]NUK87874.1 hypothetical protein [Streptomyces lunaelactis]